MLCTGVISYRFLVEMAWVMFSWLALVTSYRWALSFLPSFSEGRKSVYYWSSTTTTFDFSLTKLFLLELLQLTWMPKRSVNGGPLKLLKKLFCRLHALSDSVMKHCTTEMQCLNNNSNNNNDRPFNGLWSGTTRVGQYQKELSPLTPIRFNVLPLSSFSICNDPWHPLYPTV